MSMNHTRAAGDLASAIDDLQDALGRAAGAVTRIRSLIPDVNHALLALDEVEAALSHGPAAAPVVDASPPLRTATIVPDTPARPLPDVSNGNGSPPRRIFDSPPSDDLRTFRIDFESRGTALDLRAIDDAVSAHDRVRDVALLDYDGRRAALKVWIDAAARPDDVRHELRERVGALNVVALDHVA